MPMIYFKGGKSQELALKCHQFHYAWAIYCSRSSQVFVLPTNIKKRYFFTLAALSDKHTAKTNENIVENIELF